MPNVMDASNQWASRPPDETFSSLEELHQATRRWWDLSRESETRFSSMEVATNNNDLVIIDRTNGYGEANLSTWAMGQLCQRFNAPASYIRSLPASLAVQNLEYGRLARLAQPNGQELDGCLLYTITTENGTTIRAVNGEKYSRLPNYQIAEFCLRQQNARGFRLPPARPSALMSGDPRVRVATASDVLNNSRHPGLGIQVGDLIQPAGAWASNHDCFIVMVDDNQYIEDANGNPLYRAFIIRNGELGEIGIRFTCFYYESVCGNLIFWNTSKRMDVSLRHIGDAASRSFKEFDAARLSFSERSAEDDRQLLVSAQRKLLGPAREDVISKVWEMKSLGLSKQLVENAYDRAEEKEELYGDPRSVWGMVNGITELSQETTWMDKRNQVDRAAGKLLATCF